MADLPLRVRGSGTSGCRSAGILEFSWWFRLLRRIQSWEECLPEIETLMELCFNMAADLKAKQ